MAVERQIAFFKSVISPDEQSKKIFPTPAVNNSIIAKNNAIVIREENSAYLSSMKKTEETRNNIMEKDSILNTLRDEQSKEHLDLEDIAESKARLRVLMG